MNNHHISILFYCLKTFCNIKFLKYLPLGMFYLELYSSFLLTKPSAVQYKLSISFRWGTCNLSFFSWARLVRMWIFIFLISPSSPKVLLYKVPFSVSRKFWNIKYPHLNVRSLHFKQQWHRLSDKIVHWTEHINTIYVEDTSDIVL